jgi:hypothetical protein
MSRRGKTMVFDIPVQAGGRQDRLAVSGRRIVRTEGKTRRFVYVATGQAGWASRHSEWRQAREGRPARSLTPAMIKPCGGGRQAGA